MNKKLSIFLSLFTAIAFINLQVNPAFAIPDTVTLRPDSDGTYNMWDEFVSGNVFSDGFESGGFSAWTGTEDSFGSSSSVVTTPVHHGSYSAKETAGTLATAYARVYKTITPQSTVYVRTYMLFPAAIPDVGAAVHVILQWTGTQARAFATTKKDTDAVVKWAITYYDEVAGWVTSSLAGTVETNIWYSVELKVTIGAAGTATLWVDGTQMVSITGNLGTTQIDRIDVSSNKADFTTSIEFTVYHDCVVVADTYIGTENRSGKTSDLSNNSGVQISSYTGQTVNPTTRNETFNIQNTTQTGTINNVTAYMTAKATASSQGAVILLRTYNTNYESSNNTLTTSWANYSYTWATNPYTGSPWTWAEINATEIGSRPTALANGQTIQVSEFWIVVFYTVAGQNYQYSTSQILILYEARAMQGVYQRVGSELLGLYESLVRQISVSFTQSQLLSLSSTVSRLVSLSRIVSDTLTLLAGAIRNVALSKTVGDLLNLLSSIHIGGFPYAFNLGDLLQLLSFIQVKSSLAVRFIGTPLLAGAIGGLIGVIFGILFIQMIIHSKQEEIET